jgi:hypothetical protein
VLPDPITGAAAGATWACANDATAIIAIGSQTDLHTGLRGIRIMANLQGGAPLIPGAIRLPLEHKPAGGHVKSLYAPVRGEKKSS